jgi:hypothetical protein
MMNLWAFVVTCELFVASGKNFTQKSGYSGHFIDSRGDAFF